MTTRKQDYEHAYTFGTAAADEWFSSEDSQEEIDARDTEWQRFRSIHGLTGSAAVTPDADRMRLGFMDGWNDFSDREPD